MIKVLMLSIFFVLVSYVMGQKLISENELNKLLRSDSTLEIDMINQLYQFRLNDTIGIDQVWLSEYALTDHFLGVEQFYPDSLFMSDRLKAIYWIWLIYNGDTSHLGNRAKLKDICTSRILFDHRMVNLKQLKTRKIPLNSKLSCTTEGWLMVLENNLETWMALVNKEGLGYVRLKDISPLGSLFIFEIQELNDLDVLERKLR